MIEFDFYFYFLFIFIFVFIYLFKGGGLNKKIKEYLCIEEVDCPTMMNHPGGEGMETPFQWAIQNQHLFHQKK